MDFAVVARGVGEDVGKHFGVADFPDFELVPVPLVAPVVLFDLIVVPVVVPILVAPVLLPFDLLAFVDHLSSSHLVGLSDADGARLGDWLFDTSFGSLAVGTRLILGLVDTVGTVIHEYQAMSGFTTTWY